MGDPSWNCPGLSRRETLGLSERTLAKKREKKETRRKAEKRRSPEKTETISENLQKELDALVHPFTVVKKMGEGEKKEGEKTVSKELEKKEVPEIKVRPSGIIIGETD